MELPLLEGDDQAWYPPDGSCPSCGASLDRKQGVAFVDGGALLFNKSRTRSKDPKRLQAFLRCGVHGGSPADSAHAEIVRDLERGQFEIQFCSLTCLRTWINRLLDDLEARLDSQRLES